MNTFDFALIGIGPFGVALWVRGCWRQALGDCGLGLTVGLVSCVLYFFLFSLTRTAWLATMILAAFFASLVPFRRMLRSSNGRLLLAMVIVLVAAAALVEYKMVSAGNALLVVEPYRSGKGWAFDEPRLG